MIRNIQRRYFEIWGSEEAQNVFLKGLLAVVTALFIVQSIALTVASLRSPTLIALGSEESRVFKTTPPPAEILEIELRRTLKQYLLTHYTWNSSTVEKAHADAAHYVSERFVKAFEAANADQVKIAKEKKVDQKVYVTNIQIDAKRLAARVTMDRIFSVEGLRAAGSLVLDVTFEYGPRREDNPEGLYITGEKIVTPGP